MQEAKLPASTEVPTGTPAATEIKDGVTLTKEEHAELIRKASEVDTARDLQGQADRKNARLEKILNGGKGVGSFAKKTTAPPASEGAGEGDDLGILEDRKAERGLLALAIDPKFREVLDADPTLRDLLTRNPLAVLPVLAPDALDAEDAIDLVKESLNQRLVEINKKKIPEVKPVVPPVITPPAGGISPEVNADYEAAKKLPGTEQSLVGMIGAKLKGMVKK